MLIVYRGGGFFCRREVAVIVVFVFFRLCFYYSDERYGFWVGRFGYFNVEKKVGNIECCVVVYFFMFVFGILYFYVG